MNCFASFQTLFQIQPLIIKSKFYIETFFYLILPVDFIDNIHVYNQTFITNK